MMNPKEDEKDFKLDFGTPYFGEEEEKRNRVR